MRSISRKSTTAATLTPRSTHPTFPRWSSLSASAPHSNLLTSSGSTWRGYASTATVVDSREFSTGSIHHAHHQPSNSNTPSSIPRQPLFNKILIANRGEIACRIMRTAQKLGIKCVAVFSEADRDSQHVKMADESYLLGPSPSSQSYLLSSKILEICLESGAEAVHPGYGFMSENAKFAGECEEKGIRFIGPPVGAIVSMGSKSESKEIMSKAGVPCVPGWHPSSTSTSSQDPDFLLSEANKIGYPVLIKCVSGGGGKGMKIVEKEGEFMGQLESAKREGMKSFGDDVVLLEKYLETPRHVEVQIFSDTHQNHLSLFCRDCSVQRRHQKIIEEAPAPLLSPELQEDLYDKARKAAKAVGYVGAGTVEFIMDAERPENFYFMEMNTRLQVEHPVTEAITGVDLVEWQLEVAAGNPIPLTQDQIKRTGHAFECRIYAENPANNFLPDTGLLQHVSPPAVSENVRMETGFVSGDEISVFYDPLIAKLIVHGSDRTEALRRLRKALGEYQVVGPHTNIEFLKRLTENESFIDAEVETGFIPKHHDELFAPLPAPTPAILAHAGLFTALQEIQKNKPASIPSNGPPNPWSSSLLAGYRTGLIDTFRHQVVLGLPNGEEGEATVSIGGPLGSPDGTLSIDVVDFAGKKTSYTTRNPLVGAASDTSTSLSTLLGGRFSHIDVVFEVPHPTGKNKQAKEVLHLFEKATGYAGQVTVKKEKWRLELESKEVAAVGSATAPMPSRIVQVFVKVGEKVTAGTPLVMVEAMKTEHVLRAPKDGIVSRIIAEPGELVPEGKVLVEFEEEATKA